LKPSVFVLDASCIDCLLSARNRVRRVYERLAE
jgi:hypothetical protein